LSDPQAVVYRTLDFGGERIRADVPLWVCLDDSRERRVRRVRALEASIGSVRDMSIEAITTQSEADWSRSIAATFIAQRYGASIVEALYLGQEPSLDLYAQIALSTCTLTVVSAAQATPEEIAATFAAFARRRFDAGRLFVVEDLCSTLGQESVGWVDLGRVADAVRDDARTFDCPVLIGSSDLPREPEESRPKGETLH